MRFSLIVVPVVLGIALVPSAAHARGAGFGTGETIDFLTRLPKESPVHDEFVDPARGSLGSVGYKYTQFSLAIPMWTWGGEYVVYSGDRYVTIGTDAGAVAQTLGVSEGELAVPFLYKYPFGLVALAVVVLFFSACIGIGKVLLGQRVARLLADPVYQHALRLALDTDKGLNQAVDYLRTQGVPFEQAQANMQLLISRGTRLKM